MMRRTRTVLGWLGIWVGLTGQACAQAWNPAGALAQPGWVWADVQRLDPPQARISVWTFQAPVPPPEAARRLTAVAGQRLTWLQWAGSMLLLSGGHGAEHWLAQLQPQAGGTAGLVSRLVPLALADTGFDPAALAPSGARRVLQVRGRDEANPASLSSFDCAGRLDQVAAAVRRALLAAGWAVAHAVETSSLDAAAGTAQRGAVADAAPLPVEWRHAREGRLSVHLHARARSIALTFWHHPQEPS